MRTGEGVVVTSSLSLIDAPIVPPRTDACDPDEWHAYFSKHGTVAAVTVDLDNSDLTSRFALRRALRNTLERFEGFGAPGGDLTVEWKPGLSPGTRRRLQGLGMGKDRVYWMEQFQKNELEIHAFLEHEYFASKVVRSTRTIVVLRLQGGTTIV